MMLGHDKWFDLEISGNHLRGSWEVDVGSASSGLCVLDLVQLLLLVLECSRMSPG